MPRDYSSFIASKTKGHSPEGIDAKNLNKHLFDFQGEIVTTALRHGRYANFAECGLGKSIMELEYSDQCTKEFNKPSLILTPLAVAGQMIEEGQKFGIEVKRFAEGGVCVHVANYEQLPNIDVSKYISVVADESSLLKNFEGKTKQRLIESFANFRFKFPNTATPSPNDPMELGNHAEFLNVMSRNEMLAMYFIHDGGDTSKWRIKRHGQDAFYRWVAQWSMMITSPADLGYDDTDFILPPLNIEEIKVETPHISDSLFNDVAVSATQFNAELRRTMTERLEKAASYVLASDEPYIVWVKQDVEADYIKKLIPEAIEVRGSQSTEEKEEKLLGFAHNQFRVLITKPRIAQYGLNYQHCNNQVFPSLDFSFESLYQSIRRSYRFGQKKQVNIKLISTDTMQSVLGSIKQKQEQWQGMIEHMKRIRREA